MADEQTWPALLKDLSIANFRGIREGKLENLTQVNIIAGRNNSGKSTILESLVLAKTPLMPKDALGRQGSDVVFQRRGPSGVIGNSWLDLWFRFNPENEVSFALGFHSGYVYRAVPTLLGQAVVSLISPSGLTAVAEPIPVRYDPGTVLDASVNQVVVNRFRGGVIQQASALIRGLGRLLTVDDNYVRQVKDLEDWLWHGIITQRKDRKITNALNEAYDLHMESIGFVPDGSGGYRLSAIFPDIAIPLSLFGDGIKYSLALLSCAVSMKDTMLLIEEPESHQHPEGLQRSMLALLKVCKENRIQVLMTTHSLEAITYTLEASEKEGLEARLYHVSLDGEGRLSAEAVEASHAKLLASVGPDPRLLYKYAGW